MKQTQEISFGATAQFGMLIARVKRKMRKRMNDKLKPYNLTAEQRAILLALCNQGSMSQIELCDLSSMEPSNLSVTLKRLESKGYIEKIDHPNDPRAYLVQATKLTHDIAKELSDLSVQLDANLFENIDDEALKITYETLKKIDYNLANIVEK